MEGQSIVFKMFSKISSVANSSSQVLICGQVTPRVMRAGNHHHTVAWTENTVSVEEGPHTPRVP